MIGQWFQQKAPILALESPDLKIYCICFELALNGLLIVSSDALEPFQEVHLDQTWFVLVPSVVFNLRELHVTEIYRLAAWTQDLGLLLFFCSRSLSLLLYQGRGFGLLQQAIHAANLTCHCTFRVFPRRLFFERYQFIQVLLQVLHTCHSWML